MEPKGLCNWPPAVWDSEIPPHLKLCILGFLKVLHKHLHHLLPPPNLPASAVKLSPNIKHLSPVPKHLLSGSYLIRHRTYWSAKEDPLPQTLVFLSGWTTAAHALARG